MLKILANDGMDAAAAEELKALGHEVDLNHYDGEELAAKLKETDVVIIRSATKIRKDLINQVAGSQLKLIVRAGVGIDNIDHVYAKEKGIEVRNTPKSSSAAVAELAIAHMFAVARFIPAANVTMRKGEWNKKQYKGIELNGKTLGIIGMGRIGGELGKRAAALGMTVIYAEQRGKLDAFPEYEYVEMDDLLGRADFISIHVPFDKEKGAVLADAEFAKMKDGVVLINAARGGVVSEKSLLASLESGKVFGAGVDVFEEEPSKNEALLNHPRVSVTPHIGAQTKEAQSRIGKETVAVIKEHFGG